MEIVFSKDSPLLSNALDWKRPAHHRFHSIGSRSPEKLRFLAFAMRERRLKDIEDGKIQPVAPNYNLVRFSNTSGPHDPYDFRPGWQEEWDAALDERQKVTLRQLMEVFEKRPQELAFDENGFVNVRGLIHYINLLPNGGIHPYALDKFVHWLRPRKFAYDKEKKKVGLISQDNEKKSLHENPSVPPDVLYHATRLLRVRDIDCEGIYPFSADCVAMSETEESAKRHVPESEKSFVYRIDTKRMAQDGFLFYKRDGDTWETEYVPLQYLSYACFARR